jgi:hypothetical protein
VSDENRPGDEEEEKAEKAVTPDTAKADAADVDEQDDVDSMDPAAIARRVAALGEEDESEKLAREEERKLAERRKAGKKGKKKRGGGLEVAASKKLEKIGKRAEPKREVSVAADADPLIEKTVKLSDWAKQNQKTVQRVGALIAIALIGLAGWMYWDHKRETEASMALSKAIETQHAQIGEPPKDDDDNALDNGPYYKTHEERREKALEKYREVEKKFAGTGAAILARLSEASLLLDKRDADGAAAAFTEVKGSALGQADKEVKGRALEGLGFAYELKADKAGDPEAKKPFYDQAIQAYKELENTVDVKGFKELAMYHQARVHENKGDKEEAKKLLLALKEKFDKPDDTTSIPGTPGGQSFPYLREVAMDRLRAIDPAAAPKIQGVPGGGAQVLPPHIRKMLEDQQKKAAGGGGDPHGH